MEPKPVETVIDYKYSKNKYLSLYVSAKNSRKYLGGKKKRKVNFRDNHFQKSSIKKSQIQGEIERDETGRLVRLGKNVKMKEIGSCNTGYVVENSILSYPGFHHSLKDLLPLPRDYLLGEKVEIKYWNKNPLHLTGVIQCISNCGQFKLGQIIYCDKKKQEQNRLGLAADSYWFHMNCIDSLFLIQDDQRTNIRNLFIDILKLKLVHYFLYICSFKTDEGALSICHSPLKYLVKTDYDETHEKELKQISDVYIEHGRFGEQMAAQFVYGAKQNDFDYIESNWKTAPVYFHPEQLLRLLTSYKQRLIAYIHHKKSEEKEMEKKQDAEKSENKSCDENKDIAMSESKVSYIEWDTKDIRSEIKTIQQKDRTV